MAGGRPKRPQPSGRNLELYHELVCEERSQGEVARRFGVSQPRVARIRRDVAAWVESCCPPHSVPLSPGQRLHLTIATRRQRLLTAYGDYLEQFGGQRGIEGVSHLLAAAAAGLVELRPRRRDMMQAAVAMARELAGLTRAALRGPLARLLPDVGGGAGGQ